MVAHLADVEELFAAAKALRDARRKMERLSEKARTADHSTAQRTNVDLNWQAFEVNRIEHRVHAAAVDCGVADVRPRDSYQTYSVKLSGFHEYQVTPHLPRGLVRVNGNVLPE